MITNFEANKQDTHLQNILRQVNEEFRSNNVIMAFILFGVLTKYLEGMDMEGNPWPKPLPSEEPKMTLYEAVHIIRNIMNSLPTKRDWLDPTLEEQTWEFLKLIPPMQLIPIMPPPIQPVEFDRCREAFEKWYLGRESSVVLERNNENYNRIHTQCQWVAWQAAWKAK